MSKNRIPLADVVQHVTSELRLAHERAVAEGVPVMRFQECEIEFAIEAERKADGGLQVWVVKAGGQVKRSETNTIKIKYVALEDASIVAPVKAEEPRTELPERQGRKVSNGESESTAGNPR